MNDPLDEIISVCEELRTVREGIYVAYTNYVAPKPSVMNHLDNALTRLDKVAVWIENNTPEVKP